MLKRNYPIIIRERKRKGEYVGRPIDTGTVKQRNRKRERAETKQIETNRKEI